MDDNNGRKSKLPVIALALVFGSVAVFFLGWAVMYTVVLIPLGLILMLIAIIMPFAGIAIAIGALCLGKSETGTSGIVMSAIAIAVPVIAVIVTIILFGTGVASISFM